MRRTVQGWITLALLLWMGSAHSAPTPFTLTTETTQDYDLYPGDFNGDGLTDLLYIAKDPNNSSGIILSDGTNLTISFQSWSSNYLGISWSSASYNVIVADFNGDGKADMLLQSKTPGDSYLLLTAASGITAISQTIPVDTAGVRWSADQHAILAGDFNGDGKADVFLQATTPAGLNAVVTADANGQFTASQPAQSWSDGYLGFNWAATEANIFAGDFNGDGRADLLIQAQPTAGTGPGTPLPTQFLPNMNGVVLSQSGTPIFAAEGVQAWSQYGFSADWSPIDSGVVLGDFNGDKRTDAILQGLTSTNPTYLLYGNSPGSIFSSATGLSGDLSPSADYFRFIPGHFSNSTGDGLFMQSQIRGQSNYLGRVNGGSITGGIPPQPVAPTGASSETNASQTATTPAVAGAIVAPTAAGRTPGVFSVSPTGSANYRIPLQVPPGVGAVQLNLGLTYDSRGSNGIMGVGWSVAGLSAITRCNKTYAQDGAAGPVTLTQTDRLCLDGKQLKLTSGTAPNYVVVGNQYATEVETFSQVIANGSSSVTSFTVKTKNGLIYTYGGTTDSEVLAGSTIRLWALSQIADRVGNKISLTYQQSNGTYRIDHILYPTTTSGQGPFYKVLFTYGARPSNDIPSSYVDGYLVTEPNQLNSVTTEVNPAGTVIKIYNLQYTQGTTTHRNTITALQECSATTCLPPTDVVYQPGVSGFSATASTVTVGCPYSLGVVWADLNGDGLPDLVCTSGSGIFVQLNTGSGFASPVPTGAAGSILYAASFLGNGSQQVVFSNPSTGYAYILAYTSSGTFSTTATNLKGQYLSAADIDGDGLDDLIDVSSNTVVAHHNITVPPGTATFASGITIWTPPSGQSFYAPMSPNGQGVKTADFNGDGRADILAVMNCSSGQTGQVCITPLISNGASSSVTALASIIYQVNFIPIFMPVLTDWNGDGCTDIIAPDSAEAHLVVYVSNCAAGFSSIQTGLSASSTAFVTSIDWDGDGRQDLAYSPPGGGSFVLLSAGTTVGSTESLGSNPLGLAGAVDINGDGLADLVSYSASSPALTYYLHSGASTPPDLATSFTDGFGMNQSPSYVPLTNSTYYAKYTTAVYPEEDYCKPLYVVNQLTASDGTGTTYQNQLYYYGARTQVEGRGFEGFYAKRTYDSRNSLYTYDYYEQTFPYTGMEFNTTLASASEHIRAWSATPSVQTLTGLGGYQARWFPYFGSDTTTLWETGGPKDGEQISQVTKATTYGDGYGNPTQIVISEIDQDATSPVSPFNGLTWRQTLSAAYFNDVTHNCFGLPETLSDQRIVPGQTTQTRNYSYLADTTNCRTTQQIIEPGVSGLQVTIAYGFDDTCSSNGNSVAVTGENPDGTAMPTRTTYYKYTNTTSRCQLPELITNALGQSTAIAYNYNFGVKRSLTDPNGLITSWYQDDYGRNNEQVRSDNTYSLTTFYSCSTPPCWGVVDLRFYVSEVEYGSDGNSITESHTFYDGFNRVRDEESYRSNGLGNATVWNIDALHAYDSLGRKIQLTFPYSTSLNGYMQWSYDLLNRPLTQKLFQGNGTLDRTTTYSYLGRTVETTDPRSNKVSRVTDVIGNLREVIDPAPGGTTTYAFDAFGNLDQTVDAIGATPSATFNLRGFRTQMVDPDMGTWSYVGDSLNELVSWTDAKSQSFTAGYDPLGRMTSRTTPEGTSTWTWGSTAGSHNIGRLQQVAGPGYTENLGYDSVARLSSRSIVSDQTYTYYYGYNAQGLLSTVTYPTSPIPTGTTGANFEIEYSYSVGEPVEIQDVTNSTPITLWTSVANTDARLPSWETMTVGTGTAVVSVVTGYKAWTNQILSLQAGTSGTTTNLQNLGYTWDTTDNLTQRGDALQAGTCTVNGNGSKLCEVFTPDALNRLSSSTLNGVNNLTMTYDAAGDIKTKTDVGAYAYPSASSAHPHSATGAGAHTFSVDANGNVTVKDGLAQTWASYNLPTVLQGDPSGSAYTAQFSYGPEHERYREVATYSDGTETTEFVGDALEKMTASATGKTYWRHYVTSPSGEHIIVSRNSDLSTSKTFVLTDHLGSSDTVVNGLTGVLIVKDSFAAFGQRRQTNWTSGVPSAWYQTALTEGTRRGFTFHEQLDDVGFIHMNGRVYDPLIGRFLSVDPVAGDGSDSQRLNPYAYVSNRPLNVTDPSGLDAGDPGPEFQIVIANPLPLPPSSAQDFGSLGPVSPSTPDTAPQQTTGQQVTGQPPSPGTNNPAIPPTTAPTTPPTTIPSPAPTPAPEPGEPNPHVDRPTPPGGQHLSLNDFATLLQGGYYERQVQVQTPFGFIQGGSQRFYASDDPTAAAGLQQAQDVLGNIGFAASFAIGIGEDLTIAKSLGANPFKGKAAEEIAKMFEKKGYTPKGPAPAAGRGTYVNPKTGRGYHIDANHPEPKGPHVGAHRPRGMRDTLPPRDYPIGDQ